MFDDLLRTSADLLARVGINFAVSLFLNNESRTTAVAFSQHTTLKPDFYSFLLFQNICALLNK